MLFHFVRQKGPKELTDAFENVEKTKILKILGFLLFYEKNVKIELQKIIGNLLDRLRKLYMNGTVI